MKLRRWMASTLPRVRRGGKKREASPPPRECSTLRPTPKADLSQDPTPRSAPSPDPGLRQHRGADRRAPASSPAQTGAHSGKGQRGDCSLSNLIAYNYSLVTEDFQYLPRTKGQADGARTGGEDGRGYGGCGAGVGEREADTVRTTTTVTVHTPVGLCGTPGTVRVNVTAHCPTNATRRPTSFTPTQQHNPHSGRSDPKLYAQSSVDTDNSVLRDTNCSSDFSYINFPENSECLGSSEKDNSVNVGGNFFTVPRARTRIRTNPWLPSPRASPLMTSPVASPISPPRSPFFKWLGTSRADNNCHGKSLNTKCNHCGNVMASSSDSSDSESSTIPRTQQRKSVSYSKKKTKVKSSPITQGKEVDIDLKNGMVVVKQPSMPMSVVVDEQEEDSFYEQEFESTLERSKTSNSLGSRDTLTDMTSESRDGTDVMCDSFSSVDDPFQGSVAGNPRLSYLCDDESNDSEGTLCLDGVAMTNEHQDAVDYRASASQNLSSTDNELFSDTQDNFLISSEKENDLEYTSIDDNNDIDANDVIMSSSTACDLPSPSTPMSVDSMTDSAYDSSTFSSIATYSSNNIRNYYNDCDKWTSRTLPTSSKSCSNMTRDSDSSSTRTLGDIRSSLHDKVSQLRKDKLIVDEKVRQAQEEDRLRREEMMSFKKQLTTFRKQMLLNTLQELKSNLQNQSVELQTAYDKVIDKKWDEARRSKRLRNTTR